MHRLLLIIASLSLLAAVGCNKKSEPEMKQPDLAKKAENAKRVVGNSGHSHAKRRVVQAPTANSWSPERRTEFCNNVFGTREVNALLGFGEDELAKIKQAASPSPARTARCTYTVAGKAGQAPVYEAQLMIDCRRGVVHTPKMAKRGFMTGRKAERMKSVEVGMGGTYAHYLIAMGKTYKAPIHHLNFIHEQPRCSVTVRTRFAVKNKTLDIARYVERRIDNNSAPHK